MGDTDPRGVEALHRAELRFQLLVESVRDYAIFMLDPRGIVESWNLGAERIKGYRGDEIIGAHFSRFYPDEDVRSGKPERELEIAAREGRLEDEGWRVRKDGSRFWANVIITALRDEGRLVGFAKVTQDLTERRRAEAERVGLAETEAARRALATTLRSIGDAVIATDARGIITFMNPIAESLTQWQEEAARGRPLSEVFHIVNEQTRAAVESPADVVLERGVIVGLANHTVLITRNGRDIPIDDSGAPIRGSDGTIQGVVLVFRDVSGRKREEARRAFLADAAAALAESLDYETTLSKVARLAVPRWADWCAVDLLQDGKGSTKRVAVAHVDPAKVQLAKDLDAKYPPSPDAPTGVPNVLRTGRAEFYPEISDELLVAGTVDAEHLHLARELHLRSAMVVPLIARGQILGAITFVFAESERRYGEDDLRFAEELAGRCAIAIDNAHLYASEQHARRAADAANSAKDNFLATVSHELRTPLNAIMGWSKLMAAPGFDEARRERAIETIGRNAVAMAQLVEDLLDMSRIINGRMRLDVHPVDLLRVVETAIESIRPAAEARQVVIAPILDSTLPTLRGDPTRLQQVVWNLLSNAVKFTSKGGRVDVVLRRSGSAIEVCVSDSGRGIAPGFLPYVFDPFRQEQSSFSRERGGLGIGLAITRQLVELHGGTIEARSEGEGRGSTFTVHLPIAPIARASDRPPAPPLGEAAFDRPAALRGMHVLVVDDERDARDLIKAILEDCECRVTVASGVDEAMAALGKAVPDLLVSDIGMPDHDGYDLIRRVRALPTERGGDLPAAALTAYVRAEDRRRMLSAGYSMHVSKPVDPAELVAVIAGLARIRGRGRVAGP